MIDEFQNANACKMERYRVFEVPMKVEVLKVIQF